MNPLSASVSGSPWSGSAILCLGCILLVPFAIAGLTLMNAGLGRSRNAAHQVLNSLCVIAVAVAAYFVCGFAFQGASGLAHYWFEAGWKEWSWIAAGRFFLRGIAFDGSPHSLIVLSRYSAWAWRR